MTKQNTLIMIYSRYTCIVSNVSLWNCLPGHFDLRVYLIRLRLSSHHLFVDIGLYHRGNVL